MIRPFPELRRFPDEDQARAAIGRALSATVRTWWYLAAVLGVFSFSAFLIFAARRWSLSADVRDLIGAWCVFGVPVALIALLLVGRGVMRRSLWRDLDTAGVATCRGCGYDMTGGGPRCPECGETRPVDPAPTATAPASESKS